MINPVIKSLVLLNCIFSLPLQGHEDDGPEHLIEHLRARSAKGEPQAVYLLASEYDRGEILVKNEKKAFELYRQAAGLGSSAAQWVLASKYSTGKGVKKDKVEAYKWALLSAEYGSIVAQKLIPKFEKELSTGEKEKGQSLAAQWQDNFKKQNDKNSDDS